MRSGKGILAAALLGVCAVCGVLVYREIKVYFDAETGFEDVRDEYTETTEDKEPLDTGYVSDLPLLEFDWEGLSSQNSDIVGWLQAKTGDISYPIMQDSDNTYYVDHDFSGKWSSVGSIFLSADNLDLTDLHAVIYGHNMITGDMFGMLKKFRDEEYAEENRDARIYLPDGTYTDYLVIGVMVGVDKNTEAYESIINDSLAFETYKLRWESECTYTTYAWENASQIVTLSACYGRAGTSSRILVMLAPADDVY